MNIPPIIDVAGVLISSEIFTEFFCCDYEKCKGICCVEGDAGAPVTLDEIAAMEDALDGVWSQLSASAQSVIDRQGVAYADQDGDMVTSIVRGKECVFARCTEDGCWLCMLEKVYRDKQKTNIQQPTDFIKPISLFGRKRSATGRQDSTITVGPSATMLWKRERRCTCVFTSS